MARQIKSSDIFEGDIFENVRQSAIKTMEQLDKMNADLKKVAQTMKKDLGSIKLDSLKSIKELIKLTEQANRISKESATIDKAKQQAMSAKTKAELEALAIEKQKQQTAQESIKTEREQLKLTRDQERAEKQKTKEQEKAAKVAKDEATAYKQLERNTRELKNRSKELGAQMLVLEQSGRKNTQEWYRLKNQYDQTTRAAQQGDAQLKKLDRTVGDNFRNVGNYASAVNKLTGFLGQLGIAFGIGHIVRKTFETIKEFDQGMANLASVLGKSRSDIQALEKDARRLGETTKFTAGEVAQLQTEFAKLGFDETEILNATESTLNLAGATGTELGRAAEVAGATLRGFGLNAREMQRVNDVMAKSFSTSALDMEKFAESMKYVAPVAKSAGLSIEETTAMLGKLADSGIRGSQAGTSLRRIITDMAMTGKPAKQALQEISEKGITLADAFDEVGRTAQTSLLILSENMEGVEKLTETLDNADGAAKAMADTQLNTLGGAMALLTSAIEAQILGLNDASKASSRFQTIIKFLATNMGTIFTILGKVITYYGLYRAMLIAITAKQYLFNGGLLQSVKNMGLVFKSTQQVTTGTQQMATGMQNAGRTMSAIPWMAIIALAYELGTALYRIASGAKDAEDAQKKLDTYKKITEEFANKRSQDRQRALEKELSALQRKKNLELSTAKTTQQKAQIETKYLKLKEDLIKSTNDEITSDLNAVLQKKKTMKEELALLKSQKAKFKDAIGIARKYGIRWAGITDLTQNLEGAIAGLNTKYKIYNAELDYTNELLKDASNELDVNKNSTDDNTDSKGRNIGKLKEYKTELKDVNEYLTEQNELLASIAQLEYEKKIVDKQSEIDQALANTIALASETGKIFTGEQGTSENGIVTFGEQLTDVEKLIEEKYQLEKQAILDQQKEKLKLIEQGYTEQSRKEREELQKNLDELMKQDASSENKRQKIIQDYQRKIDAQDDAEKKAKLIADRDYKLSQEQFTADERLKIEESYRKQLEQIEMNDLQRNADFELKKEELKMQTDKEIVALDQQKADQINDVNDKLYDAQVQYYDKVSEKSKKTLEEELEDQKKAAEIRRELFQLGTEYFIKQSEERIKQIDKEIQAAEKQADVLRQLAIDGNIDAKESLAAQEKIIAESNRRKEKEERRKQRLQLLNTAFQTYNSKVESGSKNPLTETIRDIGLLRAFIETIPAFEKGTEDTGANGKGVDGKGGFHAILHPNERVIPKSMNDKIGTMSNEQLTKLAQEYQNGRIIRPNEQIGSALDTAVLISKLDQLTKTIELKPETNIELGEITQSMMEVVKSTKKGNTTTYNRYKIRK